MQAVAEGRIEISPEFVDHMYCCLGCRACETACPSGVQFGKLIEAAREQIQLEVTQLPILNDIKQEATELPGTEEFPDDFAFLDKRHTLESLTDRVISDASFSILCFPSRTLTSLVFAVLKIYQRSGLQTLIRRTGLLDIANALPTPLTRGS